MPRIKAYQDSHSSCTLPSVSQFHSSVVYTNLGICWNAWAFVFLKQWFWQRCVDSNRKEDSWLKVEKYSWIFSELEPRLKPQKILSWRWIPWLHKGYLHIKHYLWPSSILLHVSGQWGFQYSPAIEFFHVLILMCPESPFQPYPPS